MFMQNKFISLFLDLEISLPQLNLESANKKVWTQLNDLLIGNDMIIALTITGSLSPEIKEIRKCNFDIYI